MMHSAIKTMALPVAAAIALASPVARAGVLLLPDAPAPAGPVPHRLLCPGVVIIVLIAIFVTAAITGPLIRANTRDPSESEPGAPPRPPDGRG